MAMDIVLELIHTDIMREKLGFSADEIVYVGDNPVNDIKGARSAGWHTIWMNSTGYWDEKEKRADRRRFLTAVQLFFS